MRQVGNMLLFFGFRGQFLLLIFRQLLVLLPLRRLLRRIEFLGAGIAFPCQPPLFRRQARPVPHSFLNTLLLFRLQLGISCRQLEPFFLAYGVELVPFGRERRKRLFLVGRQFSPQRPGGSRRWGLNGGRRFSDSRRSFRRCRIAGRLRDARCDRVGCKCRTLRAQQQDCNNDNSRQASDGSCQIENSHVSRLDRRDRH